MKYLFGVLIRILSIPVYIIMIGIGIIEILLMFFTINLSSYMIEWIFKIKHYDVLCGTKILWDNLTNFLNKF